MTAVGKVTGADVVCGIVPVAAWDTPALAATGHKMPFISETMGSNIELDEDPSMNGAAVALAGTPGKQTADGPMELALTYQGQEHIVLGCLGDYNYTATGKHHGVLKPGAGGFNFTVVLGKLIKVFEYANAKPKGITFTGNPKECRLKIDWEGNQCNKNSASGTNKLSTISGITAPAGYGRDLVRFRDFILLVNATPATAWIADAAGYGTFDEDSRLCVSEFSVAVVRNQAGDQTTCTGVGTEEPDSTGFVDVTITFTVPYYADTHPATLALQDLCDSKAQFGFGMYASGPDYADPITDATRHRLRIFVPGAQASVTGPNAAGAGKMPLKFTLKAKALVTALGGGVPSDPISIEFWNDNTTAWAWA